MNPARKRTVRLVVALSAAVLLASALIYTSFSAASPALTPSQLLREAQPGPQLPAHRDRRQGLGASRRRPCSTSAWPTAPTAPTRCRWPTPAIVPDPFHEGREIIVTVQKQGAGYTGERNSLITKCPSKYKVAPPSEKQNA